MKRVYANSVTEWFVAESAEEAARFARDYYRDADITNEDEMDLSFKPEPDEKSLSLVIDDHGSDDPASKTCAQWAAERPKGFLATTEY
jgi:hypothetical protein